MRPSHSQTILRRTPLADVLTAIGRFAPAPAREVPLEAAQGKRLAADVRCIASPARLTAARDGWAVEAAAVADAGPYSPAPLATLPPWVEQGDDLPAGTDAVLAPEGVRPGLRTAEATLSAAPGEGTIPAGFDFSGNIALPVTGRPMRAADIAVLASARVEKVRVAAPRIAIIGVHAGVRPAMALTARILAAEGCDVTVGLCARTEDLAAALTDSDADATVTVGGTGEGRRDAAVTTLRAIGDVAFHGIGLRPGESAALGSFRSRPVLLLPGRLDAALAVLLAIGRPLARRLAGASSQEAGSRQPLVRKLVSTVGMADIVLVASQQGGVAPRASGLWPLQAIARAAGFVLVPPESEGYPEGATVDVYPLP